MTHDAGGATCAASVAAASFPSIGVGDATHHAVTGGAHAS